METITIPKNDYQNLLKFKQEFFKIRNGIYDFEENNINDEFSKEVLSIKKEEFLGVKDSLNSLNKLKERI